jgi:hypothetical protein
MQIRHTYDLGLQDRSQIETQLTGYANRQFQVSTANVTILDLTTGPCFQAFQGIFEDISIKPFSVGARNGIAIATFNGTWLRHLGKHIRRRHFGLRDDAGSLAVAIVEWP